ncbi:DUF6752 domain-containing protein [Nocardioides gansuensis]|nr:DUF6752 domain-containing protein [Nocardioides gansuensis]
MKLRGRERELEARIAALEAQVAECQSLHHRFAELMDVVTELLVPLASRDEAKVQETLQKYADELGS